MAKSKTDPEIHNLMRRATVSREFLGGHSILHDDVPQLCRELLEAKRLLRAILAPITSDADYRAARAFVRDS